MVQRLPMRFLPRARPSAPSPTSSEEPEPTPRRSVSRSERAALAAKKEKAHDRYVVRVYGLEPGEYAQRLAAQKGRCAICRKVPRKRYLAVDHDHRTGTVRGLLCYFCNSSVGTFEFSKTTAENAAAYLLRIAQDYPLVTQADTKTKNPLVTQADYKREGDLPF